MIKSAVAFAIAMVWFSSDSLGPFLRPSITGRIPTLGIWPINLLWGEPLLILKGFINYLLLNSMFSGRFNYALVVNSSTFSLVRSVYRGIHKKEVFPLGFCPTTFP